MSDAEAPRYPDGGLIPVLVGEPITDAHREIVRKYLGPPGPGEVLTAAMVNRAITLDREGAVPYDEIVGDQPEQDLPPSAAADIVAERVSRGRYRRVPAEGPVDWSQVTIRPDDDRPVEFPPASVLDPDPANRLQATVDDVRARREADAAAFVERWARPALPVLPLDYVQRVDALAMAATVYQGRAHDVGTDAVLEAAADFEAYLRGDEVPTPYRVDPIRPRPDVEHPASTILGYTLAEYRDLDGEDVERMVGMLQDALDDPSSSDIDRAWFRTALAILRRQR